MKRLLFIIGTRPEAIKMAPLILECRKVEDFDTRICVTGQHKTMLDQVLTFFELTPDFDLALMKKEQTLFDITAKAIKGLESILEDFSPDLTLVQGDTTTAFIGALASYYNRIKVAHIEAGLRSGDKMSPFPEEINRRLAGVIADYHFAPTTKAGANLAAENIRDNVFIVGNTVIDALLHSVEKVKQDHTLQNKFSFLDPQKKMILVTGHRRESFGLPFENICEAIASIAARNNNVQVVYPVHLNPNVQKPVTRILSGFPNVFLIEPVDYPSMTWLMMNSYFVLTDSGGVQEEAPSLGKPVLVMRDVTERTEGIEAGTAILVGTEKDIIINKSQELLDNNELYRKMAAAVNPYGDGTSSVQIVNILKKVL